MRALGERVHVPDILTDGRDLRPYKRLAAAVLETALRDAQGKSTSLQTIDARRFLVEDSPLLRHWCYLVGVHPAEVQEMANGRKGVGSPSNFRRERRPISRRSRRGRPRRGRPPKAGNRPTEKSPSC